MIPSGGNGFASWLAETGDGGTSPYTDAIDWEGIRVDTTQVNGNGQLVINYFFEDDQGNFGGLFPRLAWTTYEMQQVDAAFQTFEDYINVEFVETNDQAEAEFVLNKVDGRGFFLGVMNPPGTGGAGQAGFNAGAGSQGWDEGDGSGNPTNGGLEQGGFGFVTLIHEFGHGLGLAHPHDDGGSSTVLPGVNNSDDSGTNDLNQGIYTMMSYVDGWNSHPDGPLNPFDDPDYGWVGTPMAVDVALLQQKYGANEDHNGGNTTYTLPTSNQPGTFWSTIWDTGGTDEIAHSGSASAVIDLRPASLELEEGGGGWVSFADGIYGGFTVAHGVVIENASGGSGGDYLVANTADNALTGNGGGDTFVFAADSGGNDRITDFQDGIDLVDVSELRPLYKKRDLSIESDELGTTLHYADNSIFFEDLDRGDFSKADFILT